MKVFGTGGLAVVLSISVHVLGALAVLPVLAARPPPQQEAETSKLSLISMKVPRKTAALRVPDADILDETAFQSPRIGSGGIQRTKAQVVSITGLRGSEVDVNSLAGIVSPTSTDSIIAVAMSVQGSSKPPAAKSDLRGISIAANLLPDTVSATVVTDAAPILSANAELGETKSSPLAPKVSKSAAIIEDLPKVPPVLPSSARIEAGLAWSGSENLLLDPQSVATLAAFLQPGAAQGEELRDEMSGLLTSVPCARVHTVFDPVSGGLELRGHVPDPSARAPLLAVLRAQVGGGLPLRDMTRILPEPQCRLLDGIAALGLPQSEEQLTDRDLVGENAHVREYAFDEGDRLTIDLIAPEYPAFIYVDYFDALGQVIHLRPNALAPLEQVAANAAFSIGRGDDFDLRIAPPFGQDIAVAFASSDRLYEAERPLIEPALPYLAEMRKRVAELRQSNPEFQGEWVYLFVATGPAAFAKGAGSSP